jgi:cytochrome d ubiquinol oxidase subunit I
MNEALLVHRLQFAFTITFHYLFPQLTMGLAPLIVVLKTLALTRSDERYNEAARFWAKIFGINFTLGVVTGIPMEFQFGTNWASFSRATGGVIGQPLVMEGVFSFFLESAFLGLFLFGERRLGRWGHWWVGVAMFLGSWLSGFFIIVTDAWMQHPVAYARLPDGSFDVASFWGLLLNPWALVQYAHTMCGALVTGAFAMAAAGSYYRLEGRFADHARIFLRVRVVAGALASIGQVFPTGDLHGRYLAAYQPVTTAAMEGLFRTEAGAPIVLVGQPDAEHQRIDNPIVVNKALSLVINGGDGQRSGRISSRSVAHEHPASVLQLSHHGWPRHDLRARDGRGRVAALVRPALRQPVDALDPDVIRAVSLYRQHRRLDDR